MTNQSLYQRIGGKDAVNAATEIFYKKVCSDQRIRHFFDDIDMKEQIAKQKRFLAFAFGGPKKYEGKDLRSAHEHLVARGLDASHFNAVAENLQSTLEELNVPQDLVKEAMAIAASTMDDVLNK